MSEQPTVRLPLEDWNLPIRNVPEGGLEQDRRASEEELRALARDLDVLAVKELRAVYKVRPTGNGRYRLAGQLRATLEQACVVSLKPLVNTIEEPLQASYWPPSQIEENDTVDFQSDVEPEAIDDGRLPIGQTVFETFAAAIDPFPRDPEAELDWQPSAEEKSAASPFSALGKLKK